MDSSVKELDEIIKQLHGAQLLGVEAEGRTASVLLLPTGIGAHSIKKFLDEYRQFPERRTGRAIVEDIPSFVLHVNRFKDADSVLFAVEDSKSPRLLAVLDYHRAGSESSPRWGQHRTVYRFPVSEQWQTWAGGPKQFSQAEFAQFLEDHILDVAEPSVAGESAKAFCAQLGISFAGSQKLMELSRGISVRENSRVVQAVNLATGEGRIEFASEHQDEAGKPLSVPGGFLLAIPVFESGDLYQVPVRLRYRLRSGSLTWTIEAQRTDLVFEDAFHGACQKAAAETELPLIYGRPESAKDGED